MAYLEIALGGLTISLGLKLGYWLTISYGGWAQNNLYLDSEPLIGMPWKEIVSVTLTFDPMTLKMSSCGPGGDRVQ